MEHWITNEPKKVPKNAQLLMGNHACSEGALAVGCKFFAGYPITPSTEIAEALANRLPQVGGVYLQMEDEIASMGAIIGASLGGVKSMTATSGPGFSLMQENIGYAMAAEVPCVVINVMRPGPSTGVPTGVSQGDIMQCRWGTHGEHSSITLCPQSSQEMFDMTVQAFNLSEQFRHPVIVASDAAVGHIKEPVVVHDPSEIEIFNRGSGKRDSNLLGFDPELIMAYDDLGTGGTPYYTGLVHDESGFAVFKPNVVGNFTRRIIAKIESFREELTDIELYGVDDHPQVVFVAFGLMGRIALASARELRSKGIKAGLIRPRITWPSPVREIKKYTESAEVVIVPEMNLGQYVLEVERIVGCKSKVRRVNNVGGNIMPRDYMDYTVRKIIEQELKVKI